MNKRVLCIYPKDETTDFLRPIYKAIMDVSDVFDDYRIDTTNEDEKSKVYDALSLLQNNSTVVFLGHGASHCLYGTPTGNIEILLTQDQLTRFTSNKIKFILACRSSELLKNIQATNYIGFGNMPTDYQEVINEREDDFNYLSDITEEDIDMYRNEIVDIIVKAIDKSKFTSMRDLSKFIRLFANISIVDRLIKKDSPNYRLVADLLYEWKDEMVVK